MNREMVGFDVPRIEIGREFGQGAVKTVDTFRTLVVN